MLAGNFGCWKLSERLNALQPCKSGQVKVGAGTCCIGVRPTDGLPGAQTPTHSALETEMDHSVAIIAKSDQVLFRIIAGLTTELLVVHLKLLHSPTGLTPPIVAPKYLQAQFVVCIGVQSQARLLGSYPGHDALGRIESRKDCFCGSGKNRKNRLIENSRVSGF